VTQFTSFTELLEVDRLLKSPFYPLWMMEGMAEAAPAMSTPLGDMVIRDAVPQYADRTSGIAGCSRETQSGYVGYKTAKPINFSKTKYGPGKCTIF